ncbi:MAG: hypothetical protein UH850_11235 [Paludibacteraceae bacterium]|nr:hypothetical protein [Paludibacteraceae bacterium]
MSSPLKQNTITIQNLLNKINELPEASGGVDLPELTNEGSASDLLSGKQLIDGDGNVVTGTIPTKTPSDLTASGATVTVPAGYYESNATKTIASGSAKTPATTLSKTPSISVNSSGLITASVSSTHSVTPTITAGYVSSGTAGTITFNGSATKQLTTQAAKTITPSTSSQTAVASGRYTTGTVTVAGDANLKAENIKSGVSIFGVTGTYAGTTEDLDAVITELETKTATLNTTLEGKASGGGGSVECIYFVIEASYFAPHGDVTGSVTYMNEANTYTTMSLDFSKYIGIEVVANSAITITIHSSEGKNFTGCSTDNDVELIYSEDNVFIVNVGSEDYSMIIIEP